MYVKIVQDYSCIGIHDMALASNVRTGEVLVAIDDREYNMITTRIEYDEVFLQWKYKKLEKPWQSIKTPVLSPTGKLADITD